MTLRCVLLDYIHESLNGLFTGSGPAGYSSDVAAKYFQKLISLGCLSLILRLPEQGWRQGHRKVRSEI
jgi:hypothetical protein